MKSKVTRPLLSSLSLQRPSGVELAFLVWKLRLLPILFLVGDFVTFPSLCSFMSPSWKNFIAPHFTVHYPFDVGVRGIAV